MKRYLGCALIAILFVASTARAGAATTYIATTDSSGATSGEAAALNAAVTSAIQVANSYGYSGIKLSKSFDPGNPLDLCTEAAKPARRQGTETAPTAPAPAAVAASLDAVETLQPGDLLVVLSITRANQEFNKFTGAFTNDVLLNMTQINCPTESSRGAFAQLPGGVISKGWGRATKGALIEHYNQNPVAGIGAVAALLTSPWVNKYRLWLTVPTTFLDSFKHEQRSLEGTVYCATTEAMLDMLYETGRIKIVNKQDADHPTVPAAYSLGSDKKWYRVPGVSYCRQAQPVRPKLDDPTTEPF